MGIALLTLSTLFERLSSRPDGGGLLSGAPDFAHSAPRLRAMNPAHGKTHRKSCTSPKDPSSAFNGNKVQPLRVLQITETAARPGAFGRLVMSGRMADVCAELERLTALEEQRKLH